MLARIIFIDYATKNVRLSARPHVLDMQIPSNLPPLEQVVHDFRVLSVQKNQSIIIASTTASTSSSDISKIDKSEKDGQEGNENENTDTIIKPSNNETDEVEAESAKNGEEQNPKKLAREASQKAKEADLKELRVLIYKTSLAKRNGFVPPGEQTDDKVSNFMKVIRNDCM